MLSESVHQGILRKFEALKGETLVGKVPVKGINKEQRVPADIYVEEEHILHDLIRGFYKPAGMPYLISYQATESENNYGQQIIWSNKEAFEFETIEMRPPSSPKDNRKKSDIAAARYNLEHQIPIGILYKVNKGVNFVLGLGMIEGENTEGNFLVKPCSLTTRMPINPHEAEIPDLLLDHDHDPDLITEVLKEVKQRKGQDKFRAKLLTVFKTCALCEIKAEFTRASHIKPWAIGTDHERLDIHNGLLLCANHDYLFDKGFITFEDTGFIIVSSTLTDDQKKAFHIDSSLQIQMNHEKKLYMEYHRQFIFKP